jgi:hypothetical protein
MRPRVWGRAAPPNFLRNFADNAFDAVSRDVLKCVRHESRGDSSHAPAVRETVVGALTRTYRVLDLKENSSVVVLKFAESCAAGSLANFRTKTTLDTEDC